MTPKCERVVNGAEDPCAQAVAQVGLLSLPLDRTTWCAPCRDAADVSARDLQGRLTALAENVVAVTHEDYREDAAELFDASDVRDLQRAATIVAAATAFVATCEPRAYAGHANAERALILAVQS